MKDMEVSNCETLHVIYSPQREPTTQWVVKTLEGDIYLIELNTTEFFDPTKVDLHILPLEGTIKSYFGYYSIRSMTKLEGKKGLAQVLLSS
jgi:hypothetical protein